MKSVIISFPRSGRTWLLTLIGLNICHYKGIPIRYAVEERKKVVAATHDKTDKSLKVHVDMLNTYKAGYKDYTVLFLTRDPKDTLVSAWLHATKRKGNFDGTLSEYIRDPRFGMEKITRFTQIWRDAARIPCDFMEITYEEMVDNTASKLQAVCIFFDISYTGESIDKAVVDGTIDKLRAHEVSGFFIGGPGKPKRLDDLDSYYHRKGGCGGYVDYMTEEDIEYCEGVL